MTMRTIIVFIAVTGAPLIPLIMAWKRFFVPSGAEVPTSLLQERVGTIVISVSFFLLLSGLVWSPMLGPDYSKRRLTIIYANFGVAALVCLASFMGPKRNRFPLGISSCIVALEWAYLAAVNSVV